GYMLINGKKANIIGNVCMVQLMLDVSDIENVKMGDTVTVVGADGNEEIGFGELATLISSISYEMMCLIGKRVPRVYKKNGHTIAVVDYMQSHN
ncbi:MAG: alanine racemase C-terminal domain-containing protein, partial [Oscillospiraceae bacterium]